MRLPSGYGQIIKLGGKRRRPYAVRVSGEVVEVSPGKFVRKERYLEYFARRSEAMEYLAKYNAGVEVDKAPAVSSLPTFREVYEGFMRYYEEKHPDRSASSLASYRSAFNNLKPLHDKKFKSLRLDDLQGAISDNSGKSRSSVSNLIKLLHGMYRYAGMNDMVDKDYSQYVFNSGTDPEDEAHVPFADEEISRLWKDDQSGAALIMIYTGLRVTEFLKIRSEDVDLRNQIMRGGIKTAAGKNRVIPIHDAVLPFVRNMMGGEYLFSGDVSMYRTKFVRNYWDPLMGKLGLEHIPHDTRHTTTTLMERYDIPLLHRKLILGHAVKDITEGVYTHVDPSELVRDINRIPVF